jgi:hypothetical protein
MDDEQARSLTPDEIEQQFQGWEAIVAFARAEQMVLTRAADRQQLPLGDGCRSLNEWIASRMDLAPETAAAIVRTARLDEESPELSAALSEGRLTWDRVIVIAPLVTDGESVDEFAGLDIGGVRRQAARRRRTTAHDERRSFAARYVSIQPNLDESLRRFHGQLPGLDGRLFEKALLERADEFRELPRATASTSGQRQADALVAMAQDSLGRSGADATDSTGPSVAVFLDLDAANGSGGELGAEIEYGPRVGPNTLDELLCTGSVQVIGLADGRPVVTSDAAKAIPPAIRQTVAWRDQGCTIDGCTSRYRLQPHHIRQRRHGGSHDPDNLTTLCWYHHHVAIHGQGLRIDPDSPPQRRRLIRTRAGPDPP